ncbi:MAG TPA: hypothetical protein VMU75_16240 [Acidimicrobiales bacterium]|nr:hypothetical protein [Acidimicrobiales bacterium]
MRGFWLLAASVVAAIGIGAGVEAATSPTIYGPPGARFTAAFPVAPVVRVTRSPGLVAYTYTATTSTERLSITAVVFRLSSRVTPRGAASYGTGWTGYSPAYSSSVSVTFTHRAGARSSTLGPQVAPAGPNSFHRMTVAGVPESLGMRCGRAGIGARMECVGTESPLILRPTSSGIAQWTAFALTYSPAGARSFLESLSPIDAIR